MKGLYGVQEEKYGEANHNKNVQADRLGNGENFPNTNPRMRDIFPTKNLRMHVSQ